MKKIAALTLAAAMAVTMTACSTDTKAPETTAAPAEAAPAETTTAPAETTAAEQEEVEITFWHAMSGVNE